MADEKKTADFDPDKTVVDVRRPESGPDRGAKPQEPKAPPVPSDEGDRTVMISRPAGGAAREPQDSDRTMMVSRSPQTAGPSAGDRTMVGSAPAAAAGSGSADFLLACLAGPERTRRFPVGGDEVLIGSNASCHVVLRGTEGIHARLRRQGDVWELSNVGSAGSVIAAGRKVTTATLKSGDLVKIGDAVLRFARAGDVFSSEFAESELEVSGIGKYLDPAIVKERPILVVGAVLALLMIAILLWPSSAPTPTAPGPGAPVAGAPERDKEIDAILLAGQLLFNQGRYVAPSDRPEEENAYGKFNEVLALDPGNERAAEWLKKIDVKLAEQRGEREQAERRRREAEEAQIARQKAEFDRKVQAVLAEGDLLFEAGKIAEPAGNNALVKYQQAREMDPESAVVRDRIRRAVFYYVERGDGYRDRGDRWRALEEYRKGDRASKGEIAEIRARIDETEAALRSGMVSTQSYLVMYKDDRGQLFVLDELAKVPARYRDRAVEVKPQPAKP